MPGPAPKRSTQRRRENKPDIPITTATSDGLPRGPQFPEDHSDIGRRFWEALRTSGQAQFFEPSDWITAELAVMGMESHLKRPSQRMLGQVESFMESLLCSEADRRRAHLELERVEPESEFDAAITRIDALQRGA